MSAVLRSSSLRSKILFIRSVHSLSRRFSFWLGEVNCHSYDYTKPEVALPRNVSCLSRPQLCVSGSQSDLGVIWMGNSDQAIPPRRKLVDSPCLVDGLPGESPQKTRCLRGLRELGGLRHSLFPLFVHRHGRGRGRREIIACGHA